MLYVMTGGSGSGKSEYAENFIRKLYEQQLKESKTLVYIATMFQYQDATGNPDSETEARIKRHQLLRSGKGFLTKEQPVQIGELSFQNAFLLLEDLSNLLANEMFLEEGKLGTVFDSEDVYREILQPIIKLSAENEIVVVTNEIFSDGEENTYDATTKQFVRTLAECNRILSNHAASVTEVVCGIPVELLPTEAEIRFN